VDLIHKNGYPVETHGVQTSDGYILGLHRIPRPGAQPIVLVHGLMSSSAVWVEMGPSDGLAYILYRKGYDVWMLNTRGNIYSREHSRGRLSDKEYWDFSFHEIGIYDIPAAIDYILFATDKPKVQYIGHSQGCTAFFVMGSEKPEYMSKVTLMQALSPTVYNEGNRSPVLKHLGLLKGGFSMLLNLFGGYSISRTTQLIKQFHKYICTATKITSKICSIFDYVVCGFNWKSFNETLSPIVEGHSSQGTAAKQLVHYGQLQGTINFQRYDYGFLINRMRYQNRYPPQYNLSAVNCKVALHHGDGDWLGSASDVQRLQQSLPNVIQSRKVPFDAFAHFDFTLAMNVRPLVYDSVVNTCSNQ
ncbi:hypothetical protein KR067_012035, partial [Drosophila pandora]